MADKSTTIPVGICEDVPVVVADVTILTDFVILDIPEDDSMSIIIGRSIAYELSIYCSSLIYFSVAIAIITTKYQKHTFTTVTFCYRYHYYHITLLLNTLMQVLSFQVWLN